MTPGKRDPIIVGGEELATEAVPPASEHVDKLPPSTALALMLDRQENAITAVRAALNQIETAAVAAHDRLANQPRGRLIYVGAGTSARIGVQDGVELPPTFNWPRDRLTFLVAGGLPALTSAIEDAEDDTVAGSNAVASHAVSPDDVVIAVAASGQTAFTVGAMQAASATGAVSIGIANNANTALLAAADYPILLATGGEIIAGSTRLTAGTAQKICLNLISNMIMVRMGYVVHGMMATMIPTNEKLRRRRQQIDTLLDQGQR